MRLYVRHSVRVSVHVSTYLSIYPSVYLICMSVCLPRHSPSPSLSLLPWLSIPGNHPPSLYPHLHHTIHPLKFRSPHSHTLSLESMILLCMSLLPIRFSALPFSLLRLVLQYLLTSKAGKFHDCSFSFFLRWTMYFTLNFSVKRNVAIIIIIIWHYNHWWVFAFSAKSFQVLLSLVVSFQFLIFSFFKSSMTSSCRHCLGLPTALVPIGFHSNSILSWSCLVHSLYMAQPFDSLCLN